MRNNRRRLMIVFGGAIVVLLALFGIFKLVKSLTADKVDTTKGIAIIKEQEKLDVKAVENKIQKMEDQEKADEEAMANRTQKQIFVNSVVMGDSITQGFTDFDILDSSSVISKIGVHLTQLDEAMETVEKMNPDAIFLAYGMNDVTSTGGDSKLFTEQYKAVIDELQKKLPDSRIFINSVFPVQEQVSEETPAYKEIGNMNKALEELCNDEKVTFIDNTDLVKEEYYESDGVHFTADFYPVWAAHMAEVAAL